jgi:hypothetical protein
MIIWAWYVNRKTVILSALFVSLTGLLFTFSSEVMAVVEPHITITMDLGQTTKPFQIKNEQGSGVFTINPDGTVTSSTSEILVSKNTLTIISVNDTQSDPVIFGKWEITKLGGIDISPRLIEAALMSSGKITSGTGRINVEIQRSTNDISYTGLMSVQVSDPFFSFATQGFNPFNLSGDTRFYRVVAYNTDGATSGELESFKVWMEQILPATYTMQKIG